MGFTKQSVFVDSSQRELLEQWLRAHGTPQQVAKRCRIILLNDHKGVIKGSVNGNVRFLDAAVACMACLLLWRASCESSIRGRFIR